MSVEIRLAVESDVSEILAMIREFAEFERLSQYCEVTEEKLQTALFGSTKVAEAVMILDGEKPLGYAIFYPNFSSFRGQRGIYLEDIFLKPEAQGKKAGEATLRFIAKLAKSCGGERIDFQVLDWNENAFGFYKKFGAIIDETERHCKFTDEAFQKLAS